MVHKQPARKGQTDVPALLAALSDDMRRLLFAAFSASDAACAYCEGIARNDATLDETDEPHIDRVMTDATYKILSAASDRAEETFYSALSTILFAHTPLAKLTGGSPDAITPEMLLGEANRG